MSKVYVLDTGILLSSPQSVNNFDEHDVVITAPTIEALSDLRNTPGEKGANAREALRIIGNVCAKGGTLPGGGKLTVDGINTSMQANIPWSARKPDNDVLRATVILQETWPDRTVILVSNNWAIHIKARQCNIAVEQYKTEQVSELMNQYQGRQKILVPGDMIDELYRSHTISTDRQFVPNEYLILCDQANASHTALAKFRNGAIHLLDTSGRGPYGITPRNVGQKFALDALLASPEEIPLVILKGPAGTAKTFLAMAAALEQVLNTHTYDRVLVARPNTKFDDDIGYLKGTEEEKVGPLIRPIIDNMELLCKSQNHYKDGMRTGSSYVQDLFNMGIVSAQALAYMRGRSIANTFIVIDEAQNSTPNQAFGIVSRVGAGSKVILAGDPEQIDNPELDTRNNGLSYASECMRGSPLCAQVTFGKDECVRSALALDAITRMSGKIMQQG